MDALLIFEKGVIDAERSFDSNLRAAPINYYDIYKIITATDVKLVVAELNKKINWGSGYAPIKKCETTFKPSAACLFRFYVW